MIAATVESAGSVSDPIPSRDSPRSLTTTLAPCFANSRASTRPKPLPAPVTTATFPARAPILNPFNNCCCAYCSAATHRDHC